MVVCRCVGLKSLLRGISGQVLFTHDAVLLDTDAAIFEEVPKDTLKSDYNEWSLHLIHPPLEEAPIGPLVELSGTGQQVHFEILLCRLSSCRLYVLMFRTFMLSAIESI